MMTLLQLSWCEGGPLIDFLSYTTVKEVTENGVIPAFEHNTKSVFCFTIRLYPFDIYLELFGQQIIDTYDEE